MKGSVIQMRPTRASLGALALSFGLSALAMACGGARSGEETPVATLATSIDAQSALRPLLKRWSQETRRARLGMESDLYAFARAHPHDPSERLAEAMMAWISVERGDLDRADLLARRVRSGRPGTVRNLGRIVQGAILRRRGDALGSLIVLAPLVSKMIDPWARALLNDEVVAAALAARRYDDTIRLMEISLREAGDDERETVRASVAALIPSLPEADLLALLERRKSGGGADELEVPTLVAQHLAEVATSRKDMRLAQRLLAFAGPLLGDRGDPVAKLAQGAGAARVDARTVGLLLSNRDDESRRRGAEVAAGLAAGLGLPGSPARLATRDDGGKPETIPEALAALSADGAAIIVAGLDVEQAKIASEFAEAQGTPVLLLRPPQVGQGAGGRFTFVLGDDPSRTAAILAASFVGRGTLAVALVGESDEFEVDAHTTISPVPCGAPLPLSDWKASGVGGVVLNGSRDCVEQAGNVLSKSAFRPLLALGLAGLGAKVEGPAFSAAAGAYPIDGHTTISSLATWTASRGASPTWWAALGHDAGILAWAGVRDLPEKGTEDRREVTARRTAATEALARGSGELWTTEAHGFDGGRVLARRVSVKER